MAITGDARRFLEREGIRTTYRRPNATVVPQDSLIHVYPVWRPQPRASGIPDGYPAPDRASTENDPWHLGEETPRTVSPEPVVVESSSSSSQAPITLFEHASAMVDDRIRGLDPDVALPMYTTRVEETDTYVRNVNCWAADIDMTCISPYNTNNRQQACTLITPKHVIAATHWDPPVGAELHFITMANAVEKRTIQSKTSLFRPPEDGGHTLDITVCELNLDLPGTITPCKFLRPEDAVKFTGKSYISFEDPDVKAYGIPTFCQNSRNNREDALVMDITGCYGTSKWQSFRTRDPEFVSGDAQRAAFYPPDKQIYTGDSGDPQFIIVNNELVWVSQHWAVANYGEKVSGSCAVNGQYDLIAATLPVGYSLSPVDLSEFPDIGDPVPWL